MQCLHFNFLRICIDRSNPKILFQFKTTPRLPLRSLCTVPGYLALPSPWQPPLCPSSNSTWPACERLPIPPPIYLIPRRSCGLARSLHRGFPIPHISNANRREIAFVFSPLCVSLAPTSNGNIPTWLSGESLWLVDGLGRFVVGISFGIAFSPLASSG